MTPGNLRVRPANWAGNVTFSAARLHRPRSVDELRAIVAGAERAKALGTGHSFSRVADTDGDLISLAGLPPEITLDEQRRTVTVAASVSYAELAVFLDQRGLALPNMASLPHISVVGAAATGTHGSGDRNGSLATSVSGVELVTAGGEVLRLSRQADGEEFRGAVVALGTLGVVIRLDQDVVPAFRVRQRVWEGMPLDTLCAHFDEVFGSGYSVSVFTRWQRDRVEQVWLKQVADADGRRRRNGTAVAAESAGRNWLGARPADGPRHPVPGMPPEYCTQQLGVAGPGHLRLPHFRPEFTPSAGEELQSEYLLPRAAAVAAARELADLGELLDPVLQISEIRTVAADDLWLSPCYGRDTAAFHFTWVRDESAVLPVVAAVEDRLAPLGARPHWGKVFTLAAEYVRAEYVRLGDFAALRRKLDPVGKFRNDMTDTYLG